MIIATFGAILLVNVIVVLRIGIKLILVGEDAGYICSGGCMLRFEVAYDAVVGGHKRAKYY